MKYDMYNYRTKEEEKKAREVFFSKIDKRFIESIKNLVNGINNSYKDNTVHVFIECPNIFFTISNIHSKTINQSFSCVLSYEADSSNNSFIVSTKADLNDQTLSNAAIDRFYAAQVDSALVPYSKLLKAIADNPFFDYEQVGNTSIDLRKFNRYGDCIKYINKKNILIIERHFSCDKTPGNILVEYVEFIIKMLHESRFITVLPEIVNYYKKMHYYSSSHAQLKRELEETREKTNSMVRSVLTY